MRAYAHKNQTQMFGLIGGTNKKWRLSYNSHLNTKHRNDTETSLIVFFLNIYSQLQRRFSTTACSGIDGYAWFLFIEFNKSLSVVLVLFK